MAAAGDTARERVIGAAVELFSEHGVQGTSLRMIADRLGVAKGAVYYQFPCKDDIVLALLQPLFDGISTLVGVAETCPPQDRREVAITGLVDLAIAQRRSTCLFRRDPAVDALITRHDRLRMLADRTHCCWVRNRTPRRGWRCRWPSPGCTTAPRIRHCATSATPTCTGSCDAASRSVSACRQGR